MKLWYDRPAQYFEESLPIGNGKLGALVYGGTDTCLIQLNDITLWTGKPVDRNLDKDANRWIPKIRKALFNEDYQLADSLQLHVQGPNSQFYQPLGNVYIIDDNKGEVQQYHRVLDIDRALAHDSYVRKATTNSVQEAPAGPIQGVPASPIQGPPASSVCGGSASTTREYFASHPDKLIAIRLKGNLNFRIVMSAQVPHQVKASDNQLTQTGHATGDPQESIHFCTILQVKTDGKVSASDSTLAIRDGKEAIVYIINETSFNGFDKHPVREAAPYLEQATDDIWHTKNYTYDQFRERHIKDYQHFYNRLRLQLGQSTPDATPSCTPTPCNTPSCTPTSCNTPSCTPMLCGGPHTVPTDRLLKENLNPRYLEMLYFQYGRYLLISCSRTPGVPANLQGLWTPYLWSPWRGNYTVNINLEENYWPAFVANLQEMAMPLDGFISALADNGKHTAKNYYGIDNGWCSSHNSDLWAMTNPTGEKKEWPEWANFNLGGAWLVNALWERYLFTRDDKYLIDTALPLMTGAAEFCMDWLIKNPKNPKELITAPSTSPENEYITDKGYHGMTCYGGTADLAIIRELLENTRQALTTANKLMTSWHKSNKVTNKDYQAAIKRVKAQQMRITMALIKLHPYTVGKDGDLNEWYYDWQDKDPRHRHQSHLIGLYPGQHYLRLQHLPGDVTLAVPNQLSKEDYLNACEQTLIQKGDETTGWSTGWRINLWARLHNGEKAYQIYRKLLTFTDAQDDQRLGTRHAGGTYANLMDAHPPFQIDGNFGGTAGVCEMLMQSYVNYEGSFPKEQRHWVIELLPALPEAWSEGRVSGLCARGGFEVSFQWKGGKVRDVELKASKGGTVTLLYNGQRKTFNMKAGQTMPVKTW